VADIREIGGKGRDKGAYILLAFLEKNQKIKPGRLPETDYKEGMYLYVGRARKGLSARIKRHMRRRKKLFWHIDYLLQKAKIERIWIRPDYFAECTAAREIEKSCPASSTVIQGFGSSDCRCPGHLVYIPSGSADCSSIATKMGFEEVRIDENHISTKRGSSLLL
jgi:sugar fermentation stimulation protein A